MGALSEFFSTLSTYLGKSLVYLLVFIFFTFNFIALSISIQCSRSERLYTRVASGVFAFLFGIIYIAMNYLQYRVKIKKNPCTLCGDNPFPY